MTARGSEDVFGTQISLTTVDEVAEAVIDQTHGRSLVVAVANVHSVMSARRDAQLAQALADAEIVTPDGVPLVWALKASGRDSAVRVTGIDVMNMAMDLGRHSGVRHFFYGSTEEVLDLMVDNAKKLYPGISVAGTISPPFEGMSDATLADHVRQIQESGARVVWVGLGMPKQEKWMSRASQLLPGVALVGVGAAFDWFAGTVPVAPQWMRDRGLEWAFRLAIEPRRMWRRYIYNNPAYLVLLAGRWIRGLVRRRRG